MGLFDKKEKSKQQPEKKDDVPEKTSKEKTVDVTLLISSYVHKGCTYAQGDTFSVAKGKAESLASIGRVKINSSKKT